MQKYLDLLNKKYSVGCTAALGDGYVTVDGKNLPLMPWRSERRFTELKSLVSSGEINGISTMRTLRIVKKGSDLFDELYREADICRFILSSEIKEVFAVCGGSTALNVIAETVDGYICTFELSATLSDGEPVIDKHEIIALSGVACDRAADTQIPQSSIYVFGGKPVPCTYTDVDAELYGLDADSCAVVRAAFETAKTGCDLTADKEMLEKIVACAKRSVENTENVTVEA